MLSFMTDRLRTTASEVKRIKDNNTDWLWRDAITLDDAVRELRDAADTIDYLRNTCNDLQRDYDNLRKAMWDRANARAIDFMTEDELRGLCTDLYDYVDELKALVLAMVDYGEGAGNGMGDWFADRMCDLGF
jgi:predicted transcriptional regulator